MTTTTFAAIAGLALGAPLATGTFVGVITLGDGTHTAVVLLPNVPDAPMNRADAEAWAASVGGVLPSSLVAASLVAHQREAFTPVRFWLSDSPAEDMYDRSERDYSSFGWAMNFMFGSRAYEDRGSLLAARAVQLLPIDVPVVLTNADAAADLAGTPRPDHPSA